MEWLNENAKGLSFLFGLCAAFIGWLLTLERRLSHTVSRVELTTALKDIYDLLRPMGENIANIKGKLENHNE